jgi:hypothetical protein
MNKMRYVDKALPGLLGIGYIIYLTISGWDRLNALKIIGFTVGYLIFLYIIFARTTETYIDFKDGFKIKKL